MDGKAISRTALSTQAYEIIRRRITTLELKPGAVINVGRLSEELSISPIPIREALKQLTERGLVEGKHSRSYRVVSLCDQRVKEIFDVRILLETHALKTAIRAAPRELIERTYVLVRELAQTKMTGLALRRAVDEAEELLHGECIMGHSGNSFLRDLYGKMNDFVSIVRHIDCQPDETMDEHTEIMKAFLDRDLARARRLLVQHLENSKAASLPIPKEPAEWVAKARAVAAATDNGTDESMRLDAQV
jgi:DNA-binding GntR family transcriptional regulator